MSVDSKFLHPLYTFSPAWLAIGLLLLAGAGLIVFLIFYTTRKREIKTLSHLAATAPRPVDLSELRRKYLAMVESIVSHYNSHRILASVAHQQLSLTVRLFYAEAGGMHAEVLTLSDLKKSKAQKLAKTIEKYYPDEFDKLERGSVADSANLARQLINDNEALERKRL